MQKSDLLKYGMSVAWLVVAACALFIAHQYAENGRYKVQGPLVLDTRTGSGKRVEEVAVYKKVEAWVPPEFRNEPTAN